MSRRPAWWLDVLRLYWPLTTLAARATRLPVLGRLMSLVVVPLFTKKNFNITYIPVNATLPNPGSTVIARAVLADVIRRSRHRVVVNRCSCRDSKRCATFPVEDSCMLIGADTAVVDPRIVKHVSVDEALAHVDAKIALGLIPMTGRVRMDDFYYGVPNRGRMLTVCFCCPCCCSILNGLKYLPPEVESSVVRLAGTTLRVDRARCTRCGTCAAACFRRAIAIVDDRVVHDDARCVGCGRCAAVCPSGATTMAVADPQAAADELLARIGERVTVG